MAGEKDIAGGSSSKIDYQQIPQYLRITDGKVEGKIPVHEYTRIREASVKNKNAQSITLGKYTPTIEDGMENWSKPGPDSYIAKAGLDSSYIDMGEQWQRLEDQYGLTDRQLFDMFNKPFLDLSNHIYPLNVAIVPPYQNTRNPTLPLQCTNQAPA